MEKANLEQRTEQSIIQKTFLFISKTSLHQMGIWGLSQKTWATQQDWCRFLNRGAPPVTCKRKQIPPALEHPLSLHHPFCLSACLRVTGWNADCLTSPSCNSFNSTELNTTVRISISCQNPGVRIHILWMAKCQWLQLKFQTKPQAHPGFSKGWTKWSKDVSSLRKKKSTVRNWGFFLEKVSINKQRTLN